MKKNNKLKNETIKIDKQQHKHAPTDRFDH